mgnify:CR=1 FL=1
MGIISIPGAGLTIPGENWLAGSDYFVSSQIDAATEKIAFVGTYWNKDHATKSLAKVGFLSGTVTNSGTPSTLRVSLQDVSLTAAGPGQPDGTQDQFVDIGLAALTSDAWYQSAALSATRTVAPGDLLAVVFEYSPFNAGAIFNVKGRGYLTLQSPLTVFYGGASWATQDLGPNVILEATDGTFGTLSGAHVVTAMTALGYQAASAPDEYALVFSVPFPVQVDALLARWGFGAFAATASLALYEGTTALATVSINARTQRTGSNTLGWYSLVSPVSLTAGTTYRIGLRATSSDYIYLLYNDCAASGHGQVLPGGDTWGICSRTDAGAWSGTTLTRRPWIGFQVSGCDAGGGGAIINRRRRVR